MNKFVCVECQMEFEGLQKTRMFCTRSCQCAYTNKQQLGKRKRSQSSIEKQKKNSKIFWESEEGKIEKENRSKRAIIQSANPVYKEIFTESINQYKLDPVLVNESKQKKLATIERKVKEGTWNIWKTRNIRSYPELFVENYLLVNNISFEHDKYVAKSSLDENENSGYFLDFYFDSKKIDLEIDGGQHLKEDRIEHDRKRDKLLIDNGYNVIRIPWVNIKNKEKKKWFIDKLDEVISMIKE